MYNLDNLLKDLEKNRAEAAAKLAAWENVKRVYKKNGESFAIMSKNFENASYRVKTYDASEHELTVGNWTACSGYIGDYINATENINNAKKEIAPERVIDCGYCKKYNLDADELAQAIEARKAYYKNYITELDSAIQAAPAEYKKVVDACEALRDVLKTEKEENNTLYYRLHEVVDKYYFYA